MTGASPLTVQLLTPQNASPGSNRNELWQRLLRIVLAVFAWCSKPARIKPFRINQFHWPIEPLDVRFTPESGKSCRSWRLRGNRIRGSHVLGGLDFI